MLKFLMVYRLLAMNTDGCNMVDLESTKKQGEGQGGRVQMPSPCEIQGQEEKLTLEQRIIVVTPLMRRFGVVVHKIPKDLRPDSWYVSVALLQGQRTHRTCRFRE